MSAKEPGRNRVERENIAAMERRIKRLRSRLRNYTGRDPSWTRAELRALEWAVQICRLYVEGE